MIELNGKTIGIVGFGKIGMETGKLAKAFGMQVLANDRNPSEAGREIAEHTTLEHIYQASDFIVLHCPLFPDTQGMINQTSIGQMKDGVVIINNSRGQLIVEQDLADALNSGKVCRRLECCRHRTDPADNPLLTAKNCIITPHISWAPKESRRRLMDVAVSNIEHFLENDPRNVVNG